MDKFILEFSEGTAVPVDADGYYVSLLDTKKVFNKHGTELKVSYFTCMLRDNNPYWLIGVTFPNEEAVTVSVPLKEIYLNKPNPWVVLENDIYSLVMSEYIEDPEQEVKEIIERAKELAGLHPLQENVSCATSIKNMQEELKKMIDKKKGEND